MAFNIYVPLKISEKEQAKIDEALKGQFNSRSHFIRACINDYNMDIEEIKLRAELKGYNSCVTEIETNRQIVLQKLESVTSTSQKYHNVTQNEVKNIKKVTQSNTNSEENNLESNTKPDEENMVTPESNTNSEEIREMVPQIEDDPRYKTYKEYLPTVSKQINLLGNWSKTMKTKISEETATTPKEVVGFLYQYKEQIAKIPYENDKKLQSEEGPVHKN